jgi:hypothetical protein
MQRTHRSLKTSCANLWWRWKIISVFIFTSNGAPVEWNWQGKTEVIGEKPVPLPLCPPQIPHGLTRDQTRTSAVGGLRLTAWAMARPQFQLFTSSKKFWSRQINRNLRKVVERNNENVSEEDSFLDQRTNIGSPKFQASVLPPRQNVRFPNSHLIPTRLKMVSCYSYWNIYSICLTFSNKSPNISPLCLSIHLYIL